MSQQLALDSPNRYDRSKEIAHLVSMLSAGIEEIETILLLANVESILVCSMFENELLKIEESSFMVDFLSDLNDCSPCVLCS